MASRLAALEEALLARSGRGAKYGLERMQQGLADLGHPERHLPVVHVAGTNGKGSVCAMVTAIARAAGLRTGTFNSPHLERLRERVALDGEPIGEEPFADALEQVLAPSVAPLTFFETITATAFVAMRDRDVDLAIIEVGLGGRLDATNTVPSPLVTAITSVALDHTRILGDTTAAIAREKAGIAKPGVPLVVGPVDEAAHASIMAQAAEVGTAPVWAVAPPANSRALPIVREMSAAGLVVTTPSATTAPLTVGIEGRHQRDNAAVAVGIAHRLGECIPPHAIVEGLAQARWPGRLERLAQGEVEVLLDCAHNPHGAEALAEALAGQPAARTRLVFGALGDKAWPTMLDRLAPLAGARYYVRPLEELAGRRPAPPEELAAAHAGSCHASVPEAVTAALNDSEPGDLVVVAGSIFLVGAARSFLRQTDRDAPIPL